MVRILTVCRQQRHLGCPSLHHIWCQISPQYTPQHGHELIHPCKSSLTQELDFHRKRRHRLPRSVGDHLHYKMLKKENNNIIYLQHITIINHYNCINVMVHTIASYSGIFTVITIVLSNRLALAIQKRILRTIAQ